MEPTTSMAIAETRSPEPPAAFAFLPLTVFTALVLVLAAVFADTASTVRILCAAAAVAVLMAFCAAWRLEATGRDSSLSALPRQRS
jgi:Ni/Fe-hydrogenase subunit HybB-like protein